MRVAGENDRRRSPRVVRWWLTANVGLLLLAAIAARCRQLDSLPGLNGDEAWYGVQAQELLAGRAPQWRTPTGNPINPMFFGPLVLVHLLAGPSAAALRSVAVVGGLLALVINWFFCRRVFDASTAWISTVALAVLPVAIAYSRFAWDASQSLPVTLVVLYASLAAVRFDTQRHRWLAVACAAQMLAMWVHPANVFAAAGIAAAIAVGGWRNEQGDGKPVGRTRRLAVAAVILGALGLMAALALMALGPPVLAERVMGIGDLTQRRGLWFFLILYPRLLAGDTVYQFLAGSHSWLWGPDVVVIWSLFGWAAWRLAVEAKRGSKVDRCLLGAWALSLVGFLIIAGPSGINVGYERYGICLVGPAVLLACRAIALAATQRSLLLLIAPLAGWLLLADFHAHYFQFIVRTGGAAHQTFRTAAEEPKQTAMDLIARDGAERARVLCSEYWLYWPLRYYAAPHRGIEVVETCEQLGDEDDDQFRSLWRVEFSDSPLAAHLRTGVLGEVVREETVADAAGRSLLSLFRMRQPLRSAQPERLPSASAGP
jgi:hypothetical protein